MRSRWSGRLAQLTWSGVLACLPALALAAEPEIVEVERVAAEGVPGKQSLFVVVNADHGYWIGGHFVPVDELVKSQLNLDHGLAAVHIVADSPAAKAGLKPNDILLSFNGERLPGVEALLKEVEQSKGKEVDIKILRGGSERSLKITPEERPARLDVPLPEGGPVPQALTPGNLFVQPLGDMARWFDQDGVRMLLIKPGVVIPKGVVVGRNFPQNLSVTIKREGDSPIKISIKKDEESWELTADQLDKLPESIRQLVKSMLGGPSPVQIRVRAEIEEKEVEEGNHPETGDAQAEAIRRRVRVIPKGGQPLKLERAAPAKPRAEIRIERRRDPSDNDVQELKDQVQQLRDDLEKLKKQLQ